MRYAFVIVLQVNKHIYIVPTFNSCTKCVGSPGILHDRTPDWHPSSWTWITSKLNVDVIESYVEALMCLGYFLTCYPWGLVQPGTARRPVDWCRNKMSVL